MNKHLLLVLLCHWLLLSSHTVQSGADFYERLGVEKGASLKDIRKAFKKIALTKHPDKNRDDPKAHEKFLEITRAYEVLKDEDTRKKYDMHGEEGLKEDFHGGGRYESWNFYKNEFGLYDDDEEIITLSRSDFAQSVDGYDGTWFINFYSPNCGHCHDLAPTWRRLAQEMEGVIRIGAVNCGDEWQLCNSQGIHSYPSLIMYPEKLKYRNDRNLDDLIKFAMRYVKGTTHTLTTANLKAKMSAGGDLPWLITFCGEDGDCLSKSTSVKLSAMLNGLVNVGYINCDKQPDLCDQLTVIHETFFYPDKSLNKSNAIKITSLSTKEIAYQVFGQLPDVTSLDEDQFNEIRESVEMGEGRPWLVHFVNDQVADLELKKLPAMLDKIHIGRVDCRTLGSVCKDIHLHKFPSFVVFKPAIGHEMYYGRITAHDVAAFAKDSLQNQIQTLGPSHFPGVTSTSQPWVIDFFAPWCPPCMNFLPEFRKASRNSNTGVKFGTLDCSIHTSICRQYNVHSYPTTIFYNHSTPHHFNGQHDMGSVLEFLEDILRPSVITLDPNNFHQKVFERSDDELWVVDFFKSSCRPCRQLAPEWRHLARQFRENPIIHVAHVDCEIHYSLCNEQQARSYPTIRMYPPSKNGYKRRFESYNSWNRDADSIHEWVIDYLPSLVAKIDQQKFQREVLHSDIPWVVDYFTSWCGHCHHFKPVFARVAETFEGRLNFGKVDCDEQPWLCDMAGVQAYPTIHFYPPHYDDHTGHHIRSTEYHSLSRELERVLEKHSHSHYNKPHDEF